MTHFDFIPSGEQRLAVSIDIPNAPVTAVSRQEGKVTDGGEVGDGARGPVVIVSHGLTGQRLGRSYHLVELGRRLARRGIACVRFDQAGCGESTGRFEDLTAATMARDAVAVRRWVADQPWADADRVGYVGLSLGSLPTIAADAAYPGRAIALWAGVFDLPRVFATVTTTGMKALLAHQGWVPYRGLRIGAGFIEQLGAVDTAALLSRGEAPLLLCHSEDDEVVDIAEARDYVACCQRLGRAHRFERFIRAGHDFAAYEDRQRLMTMNLDFFANTLGG